MSGAQKSGALELVAIGILTLCSSCMTCHVPLDTSYQNTSTHKHWPKSLSIE